MLKVSRLFIYPIKSLAGISVDNAEVTTKGFKNDRRFMLVDENNRFLTIREFPRMTRLQPKLEKNRIRIVAMDTEINDPFVPFDIPKEEKSTVLIWNANVEAFGTAKNIDDWFSTVLESSVQLVYMPEDSMRPVDTTSGFKPEGKFVSFADAYPFMMMGEASIDELNERYQRKKRITVHRFRPNIVFSGGYPNQEDQIENFTINGVSFTGLENCARCTIPKVDPQTGIIDTNGEPMATLSKYRLQHRKINFGRNLVHSGIGKVHVGDVLQLKESDSVAEN